MLCEALLPSPVLNLSPAISTDCTLAAGAGKQQLYDQLRHCLPDVNSDPTFLA